MNVTVVILRQSLDLPALSVEGFSRAVYQFLWDTTNGRYAYTPKSQFEIDDLMLNQGYFYFTVVDLSEPSPGRDTKAIGALSAALPELDKEELDVIMATLGIKPQTNESNSTKVRVIDTFLNGIKYHGNLPRIAE
jgi:hypothetical protein